MAGSARKNSRTGTIHCLRPPARNRPLPALVIGRKYNCSAIERIRSARRRRMTKYSASVFLLSLLFAAHLIVFGWFSMTIERRVSPDSMNYISVARNAIGGDGFVQSAPGFNQPTFWADHFSPDAPRKTRSTHNVGYSLGDRGGRRYCATGSFGCGVRSQYNRLRCGACSRVLLRTPPLGCRGGATRGRHAGDCAAARIPLCPDRPHRDCVAVGDARAPRPTGNLPSSRDRGGTRRMRPAGARRGGWHPSPCWGLSPAC